MVVGVAFTATEPTTLRLDTSMSSNRMEYFAAEPFGSHERADRTVPLLAGRGYFVGTRRFNSSNQLTTTLIWVADVGRSFTMRNRWPSRVTS